MNWKYDIRELPDINDVVLVFFDTPTEDKSVIYGFGFRKIVNSDGDWLWHNAKTRDLFIYNVKYWCNLEHPKY